MEAKVVRLMRKSNFDKRPRFSVNGLGCTVIIEANTKGDAWDEERAKAVADNIANAFNNPNIFGRGHDEV
jgi:hypothetical protein